MKKLIVGLILSAALLCGQIGPAPGGGGGGGGTIPSTTDILKGDGAGNALDSGLVTSTVITNGGSYSNPGWITALANSKITGLTAFALVTTGATSTYMRGDASLQTLNCAALSNSVASCSTDTTNASNISSGTLGAGRLPNPSATTLGGIESLASASHKWLNAISTSGVPAATQPACGDLSDSVASCNTDATNASNIGSGTLNAARLPSTFSIAGPITLSGSNAGTAMLGCASQSIPGTPANAAGIVGPASCTGQHVISLPAAGASASTQVFTATGSESGGVTGAQWTAVTGSGSVVLATSPTLTTPALGTPSAVVLTNATGLPEAGLTLANNTTANVSTSKHGFAPILPNDATKYLDGTGAYSVPPGTSSGGTTLWTGTTNPNGTTNVSPTALTSNTAPSPYVATCSTSLSGYPCYYGFGGNGPTGNPWYTNNVATGTLGIYLGTAYSVGSYAIESTYYNDNTRTPKSWTFQGSNDGSTWTTLDTEANITGWVCPQTRTYYLSSPSATYSYFQLNITANNGSSLLGIQQMYIYLASGGQTEGSAGDFYLLPSTKQFWGPRSSGSTPTWPLFGTMN